jgi:acyl-CoA reductase-like NAD-dependent aldehyde dehydrogenase
MTSAAPSPSGAAPRLTGSCVTKLTDDPAVLEIRDPADQRSVVAEVPAMRASDVVAAYERARAGFGPWRYGCYVEPTIMSVNPRQALWRDEVFGPVVAACVASGFDEAVELANDSRYGLSAAVFTSSLRAAGEFIDRAEAGQVAVNLPTSGWDVHHPFGGFRDSGSPFKEQGAPGLRFYTRLKTTAVRFAW